MRGYHSDNKMTRVIISILFIALVAVVFSVNGVAVHMLSAKTQSFSVQNRHFIGTWYSHGDVLTIKQDGQAHFTGRVYRWCTEGPAPCDTMDGNTIIPGIQRAIVFEREQGNTLYGRVTSSTDHTEGHTVTASIKGNDMLDFNGEVLCGPNAPLGTCGV